MTQPTFTQVRAALAAQLSSQISGLRVSANRNAVVSPPAAVVMPATGTIVQYQQTMDGAADLYLRIIVLVSEGDSASGQDLMDPYLATSGAQSVFAAVQADPTLGRVVSYADVIEATGYSLMNWAGIDYLGCSFIVRGLHMRWLIAHPGPSFSVHDLFMGWTEALRALGEDVYVFNLDHRLQFYDCALIDTGITDHDGHRGVRKALDRDKAVELAAHGILSACYQVWPDVVLGVSAFFLPEYLLDMMRGRGHKVVLLHSESPYQDDEQRVRAAHADVNLLNDPVNIAAYHALGVPAAYMPHAYRPAVHRPGPMVPEWACDLAFAGTGFPSRIGFFEKMLPRLDGVTVKLAGFWEQLDKDSPLREWVIHDPDTCLDNDRAVSLYRSAKCGINIYRQESETTHAGEGWAMGPREVELAASGLFFLRDPRPEGDVVFPMLPTFTSPEDAADQLRWWLGHDQVRRKAADEARAAVAGRTFENNAKALMRLITEG